MTQFRPLLAYDAVKAGLQNLRFPLLGSPKIDGIRCLIGPEGPVTRTLKPIPNHYIRTHLSMCPPGLDGELTVGEDFQSSTSAIMSHQGSPDFTFHVFDTFLNPEHPFGERYKLAQEIVQNLPYMPKVKVLEHFVITSLQDLELWEERMVAQGFEGLMVRKPSGIYKHGRSTANERILGKIKRFETREAQVIGIEPLYRNENPAERDALLLSKRNSSKDGKIPQEILGSLVVKDEKFKGKFQIGTGFSLAQRQDFFHSPPLGKIVSYKYMPHGTIDAPRHPVFLGFRDKDDL